MFFLVCHNKIVQFVLEKYFSYIKVIFRFYEIRLLKIKVNRYMLHSCQIRAARAFLMMSSKELADLASISTRTVQLIERKENAIHKTSFETIKKIRDIFEERGIEFTEISDEKNLEGIGIKFNPYIVKAISELITKSVTIIQNPETK